MAFGPSLGGLAEHISGNPYVIFYVALGLHVINALFTWFIIPESLLPAQMDAARRARGGGTKRDWFGRMFSFLAPLKVLAPLPQMGSVSPQKTLKRDWSLTWVALSYVPESLLLGGAQYWLQYAAAEFNWTAEIVRRALREPATSSKINTSLGGVLHKLCRTHSSSLLGDRIARLAQFPLSVAANRCTTSQLSCSSLHPEAALFSSPHLPTSPSTQAPPLNRNPRHPPVIPCTYLPSTLASQGSHLYCKQYPSRSLPPLKTQANSSPAAPSVRLLQVITLRCTASRWNFTRAGAEHHPRRGGYSARRA